MSAVVPVVIVGAASAAGVILATQQVRIGPRLVAGVGGAAALACLAVALQSEQDLRIVLATAGAGAALFLAALEFLGPRTAAAFVVTIALAGIGGAALIVGLSSVALSTAVVR